MQLHSLTQDSPFPPPENALKEPNGLLAMGGDLSSSRLMTAYRHGIFPWYNSGEPILWWSPDPRAVIYPQQLHISHSLKKFIRRKPYRVTLDHDFPAVIQQCSVTHSEGTWINAEMCSAYIQLHRLGFAHSVEVWLHDQLVGGLYGVAQGQIFCGESMFSQSTNASKYALVAFCQHLIAHNFALIDSQILNPHTSSMGAIEISRAEYLALLRKFQYIMPKTGCWDAQELVIKQ